MSFVNAQTMASVALQDLIHDTYGEQEEIPRASRRKIENPVEIVVLVDFAAAIDGSGPMSFSRAQRIKSASLITYMLKNHANKIQVVR